jgi:hypothetical protein
MYVGNEHICVASWGCQKSGRMLRSEWYVGIIWRLISPDRGPKPDAKNRYNLRPTIVCYLSLKEYKRIIIFFNNYYLF